MAKDDNDGAKHPKQKKAGKPVDIGKISDAMPREDAAALAIRAAEEGEAARALMEAAGIGGLGAQSEIDRILGRSSQISDAMRPLLDEYAESRKYIDEALNGISGGIDPELLKGLDGPADLQSYPRPMEIPEPTFSGLDLPPNPIHETNEHLENLAGKIDVLAEHQAKQVKLSDTLLLTVMEAATAAETTGRTNQRIAIFTLCISALAVIAAIAIPLVSS